MTTNEIAIRVSHVGKKYTIGGSQERYHTLRDAVVNSVKAPFKRFHRAQPDESFWALKDVSFDVEQGEVIGIIGRNGAGKSTLLKILSRITTPTEGIVELYGRVGSLLEVGTGFHPELTGRENIFLSGSIIGMKRCEIDAKLDEIMKFSEIEKFLDTPVKRYSSGMYVRLAFAVAAHMDTEILLIDEVLAVGDAGFQKKCLGKMGDVAAKEGRTVLFVSHNMAAVQKLCQTGILLKDGLIKANGDIEKVTSEYLQLGMEDNISWKRSETPNTDAYFERIYFCDDSGNRITHISPVGTANLVIEFTLEKNIDGLKLAYSVANKFGDHIFSSSPEDTNKTTPLEMGRYIAKIRFPNDFFLFQNYVMYFALYVPLKKTYEVINPIVFSVEEINCWSNRNAGGRVGYLAIPCEWKIQLRTNHEE